MVGICFKILIMICLPDFMLWLLVVLAISFGSCTPSNRNLSYLEECEQFVLEQDKVGEEFVFKPDASKIPEYRFTYLGSVPTKNEGNVKILSLAILTGIYEDNKRGNGVVILFNNDNRFLGAYVLGDISSLLTKILGNELMFSYNDASCDQETAISFYDSIPKQIFVGCSNFDGTILGDLYSLGFEDRLNE